MRQFALLLAGLALAADWPHVRGPDYDSTSAETGLADHWPEAGPPVLWTRELGPGYAGFVVAEGRAFTLYQTATGMFLTALDADTGAELWAERVDWPWQPGGLYPGPYASPTWHAGHVYYATPTGRVGCVAAADGRDIWTVDLRSRFAPRGTDFGFAATPLVADGRVMLPVGGDGASMVALNAADGSTVWASGDDPASYCPARPVTVDGRRLIVGLMQNVIVLHDATTGERAWRHRLSGSYDEHAAWPLTDGQTLLVASPFRVGTKTFRLSVSDGRVDVIPGWAGRQLSNDVCSSVLVDGSVYGFDLHQAQASARRPGRGVFKCLDFDTGMTRWESDRVGQATPLVADGKLILWSETGELVMARATPDRYDELGRMQVLGGGPMCWAVPALADRRLYVRDHDRAACVYLGRPEDLDPDRPTVTLVHRQAGFDWTRVVPQEPAFPNDAPTPAEVGRWFGWCVGLFIVAGLGAGVVRVVVPGSSWVIMFGLFAVGLGTLGTTAIGTWARVFVPTWPIVLFVGFRGTLWLGQGRTHTGWRSRVIARVALVGFVGLCYGYYWLGLAVGYAMGWGFLAGFVAAVPFGVVAVRADRAWVRRVADGLGFTAYFWASGLFPGWKAAWAGG